MASDMEKLVKDWFTAWNSRDPEKVAQCYTDDAVFESVYAQRVSHGKPEMLNAFKATFTDYPDFKIEQKATFYSQNAVCGEVVISATQTNNMSNPSMPITGKKFTVRGAYVSEWQNDKVKRHAYYQDLVTVMQQLGLMPEPSK